MTTIIEQLNASGRTTGTVLSKEYLYSVFGDRATHRWEPFPVIPVSGHAPDAATMDAALAMIDEFDPAMMFVNLGDVDRVGHSDLTGTTLKAARTAALASTNIQVGRFVDMLKSSGKWASSHGHRARGPLDGLVAAPADDQPDLGLRRGRLAGRQLPDRAERRRRPRLLDRSLLRSLARP